MKKAPQLESKIEGDTAKDALELLGVFSIKLKRTQERGYPDRLFLIPGGVPLFIEFKRPGCSPEPYQLLIHERLRHAGYKVEVHDNVKKALAAIRRAVEAGRTTTEGHSALDKPSSGCALLRSRRRED